MKRMRFFVLALILALGAAAAVAQEKAAEKKDMKAGHDHSMMAKEGEGAAMGDAVPKPAPEMGKLSQWLRGRWETTEKHEPSPWMPQGATGMGTERVMSGPGGFSLVSNYASRTTAGSTFRGHGVVYWDNDAKVFRSFWCDNMTPKCQSDGTGKWEGEELVFKGEIDFMGTKMNSRAVYTNIKPDSFTFYMEAAGEGGAMKRIMTAEYKKSMSRRMQHMKRMEGAEKMEKNE
ncbi:MAG: DUF1579 family protein [Terriglobales bacterium]